MLLVLHLTENVLFSGLAYFSITLASTLAFLVAPFANYVTYKKGLIVSGLLKSALLFTIPLFYLTTGLNVFYVLVLLFTVALISQFTYPIESTITPIIVGKDHIIKANSFLHTIREGMDIAFLAGAGILVVFVDLFMLFLLQQVVISSVRLPIYFLTSSNLHCRKKRILFLN